MCRCPMPGPTCSATCDTFPQWTSFQADRLRRKVAVEMARVLSQVDLLVVPALRDEMFTIISFTGPLHSRCLRASLRCPRCGAIGRRTQPIHCRPFCRPARAPWRQAHWPIVRRGYAGARRARIGTCVRRGGRGRQGSEFASLSASALRRGVLARLTLRTLDLRDRSQRYSAISNSTARVSLTLCDASRISSDTRSPAAS